MRFSLFVFYKRIIKNGFENIPLNKPSIFACTHPNSFLDAIIIGVYSPRKLYFLARSDVFNTPFKKWLLSKMNLIPIYRLQEGSENLHKNEDTFAKCFEIMKKGGSILIFSEGISITDKLVRPLKKGTARIAFGAESYNNFSLDLQIVPMSLNYTYPAKFRTEVIVGVEKPIALKDYKALYLESEVKAIRKFNEALLEGIKAASIIVDEKTDIGKTYEIIAPIYRSQLLDQTVRLDQEQRWANLADLPKVIETAKEYSVSVLKNDITNEEAIEEGKVNPVYRLGISLAFYLFFILGYVPNALPFVLAEKITDKKVRLIEFYASVRLCLSVLIYLIYLPTVSYIVGTLLSIQAIIIGFFFILSGTIYASIRDTYRKQQQSNQFFSSTNFEKTIVLRNKLLDYRKITE
jgi:1-acyl-sn-glycerol-3-phosphate acyltransferase